METNTKNGLKTYVTTGQREYLLGEQIKYCGASDWWELSDLRDGMFENLQTSVLNQYGCCDVPESTQNEFTAVVKAIKDVTLFREEYLRNRIRQLEQALNLKHNQDIDD